MIHPTGPDPSAASPTPPRRSWRARSRRGVRRRTAGEGQLHLDPSVLPTQQLRRRPSGAANDRRRRVDRSGEQPRARPGASDRCRASLSAHLPSISSSRPPGRSTRSHSATARSGSGRFQITCRATRRSYVSSALSSATAFETRSRSESLLDRPCLGLARSSAARGRLQSPCGPAQRAGARGSPSRSRRQRARRRLARGARQQLEPSLPLAVVHGTVAGLSSTSRRVRPSADESRQRRCTVRHPRRS